MSFHRNARGRDLHAPTNELVENNTGVTITALKVVKFNGYGSIYPQVQVQSLSSNIVCGVMQEDLLTGKAGYICSMGLLIDVDTHIWSVNTLLYGSATGDLSPTAFGVPVAIVMRSNSTNGVLYVINTIGFSTEEEADDWHLDGNALTNADPATGSFIGTTDVRPLRARTQNLHRFTIDEDGRFGFGQEATSPPSFFYLKSHLGFPGSGQQKDTFAMTTSTSSPTIIYSFQVPNLSTAMITVNVAGRQEDGTAHCAFRRTLSVYREGSQAFFQGGVQSDFTQGGPGFNVTFSINIDTVQVMVTNSSGSATNWGGSTQVEVIS